MTEALTDLAKDAKELESDGAKFMDPGAKRKRGRPKGSTKTATSPVQDATEPAPEMAGPPTVDIVRPVVQLASGWTKRIVKDDRAAMLPEEVETISVCTAALIDKYAMSLGKYAVEIAFAATVGAYGMRVYAIHETNKERERNRYATRPDNVARPDGTGNGSYRDQTVKPVSPIQSDGYGASTN